MVDTTTPKPIQKPALLKPTFITMNDVEPSSRVTMHLRVHSVKIVRQRQRYDGEELNQVAECLVGDANGCCKMIATDSQLEVVKEGAAITIRNAHANVVKEHLRIEVDRWAKVEACKDKAPEKVNTSKNLSDVEYELVTVKA